MGEGNFQLEAMKLLDRFLKILHNELKKYRGIWAPEKRTE